jgi:superfamily II DNA or RNA helicase
MNILIEVDDIYSTVKTVKALPLVRLVCRARPDGYMYMKRFRQGRWDGYISLMNGMNKFPTGLMGLVLERLEARNHIVTLNRNGEQIGWEPTNSERLDGVTMRPYQVEAVNDLLERQRGVAKMATNAGKTICIAAILQAVDKPGLVIVHTKELLHQTAERISIRTGEEVGKIGDGIWDPQKFTVGMIQTLSNRTKTEEFKFFDDNCVLIVDECHHVSSNQMLDVLGKIPGKFRFGFSGTPLKHDVLADMKLIAMTGDVVVDVPNEFLIDKGFSAKPIVHFYVIESLDEKLWEMDYQTAYKLCIVENDERNKIISNVAKDANGVVLILVNRIDHGLRLQELISGSVFVNGGHSSEIRNEILDEMRNTDYGVYIATPIFDEGVDVPSVDNVVIAAGGKSHIKLLQRVGRGIRAKEGDNILHVHDFIDDTNEYLLNHSETRISIYEQEGFTSKVEEGDNGRS